MLQLNDMFLHCGTLPNCDRWKDGGISITTKTAYCIALRAKSDPDNTRKNTVIMRKLVS